jgi:type IV pilus assembly protein PilX
VEPDVKGPNPHKRSAHCGQRGASLLFVLMALVVLGLAGVALSRSIDTGTLILGNLGFRQDALMASNTGSELAIAWLQATVAGTALEADIPARGYYASSMDKLDVTGNKTSATNKLALVNWDGSCGGADPATYLHCDTTPFTGAPINGNTVQWLITRLCDSGGPASGANLCARPSADDAAGTADRGELSAGGRILKAEPSPYFRILVRVRGPRGTTTYTETLVHF